MKPNKLSKEERIAMAEKMDADLDQFMDELAANRASNTEEKKPFDFDEWCKKIDQHPAFINNLDPSAATGEYSEAIQAIQALKYTNDDDEDLSELARQHKDDGNKHFKMKKYRWAIDCYSNGIKLCCDDQQLNSVLYANRAAANKHLGNKRSAMRDCLFARKFDKANVKAIIRGAECLLELGYGKQCTEWMNSSLGSIQDPSQVSALFQKDTLNSLDDLRTKARQLTMMQERDTRKEKAQNELDQKRKQELLMAFKERQINFKPRLRTGDDEEMFDWSDLEVRIGQFDQVPIVHIDNETRQLVWPLLLQYPEAGQTDFVTDCMESTPLSEALSEVLQSDAQWDSERKFREDNVRLFVALDVYDEELVAEVSFAQCLKDLLLFPDVVVAHGLPVIQVYSRDYIADQIEGVGANRLKFKKMKKKLT